jgi:hypothetical protein
MALFTVSSLSESFTSDIVPVSDDTVPAPEQDKSATPPKDGARPSLPTDNISGSKSLPTVMNVDLTTQDNPVSDQEETSAATIESGPISGPDENLAQDPANVEDQVEMFQDQPEATLEVNQDIAAIAPREHPGGPLEKDENESDASSDGGEVLEVHS